MSRCPECDRDDFESMKGVRIHHTKVHGEPLPPDEDEMSVEMRYYYNNREEIRTEQNRQKNRRKLWFWWLKKAMVCIDCGNSYPPYVIDFDHRDEEEKESGVARLVSQGASKKRIIEEVEKCDPVCANCHRERTHETPAYVEGATV